MNREQQIEEMANSLYEAIQQVLSIITCRVIAADVYRLGYRKATNIFSELEAMTEVHEFHDAEVGNWTEQYVELSIEDIADLKKKYEVEV